ncbi:MAG: L-aspartate oxidase [Candidatus Magasanikbacteria bacterium CG_4_9_14_0_2_um_filter_42_11]|uniref:L-aspartate oxidase n=1 Tax=Candidatus Magasanikbacteria bacterium CG_4_9_14_0_2_um_filter_42_11 TaxID=1974643 RepID=A0A2M8FAK8_9BACT|nr:MAG: L-aspartate oxidase [Candidatus Magasanikbacteria bacterium CG10_big_fil_rev_8_21_14_0_10_43_9]PIY92501.1 MAG: L-aspartate oxidase [Candidatus Magasanikbacteria bacterium CG_4_10_14_0_8_um_filter_42_12]PJC52773.1 MAG: L-aspartate oxidase [Candidatus Magasanikbacteria bacterium CG_4_9_14_0_2_um_filter_42_11]
MTYDFLVIGSGISGLNFALDAAEHGTVAIVTKKELMESNSNYAQGGIAAVLDSHDSFDAHVADTLTAGCHINDLEAVTLTVTHAPAQIQKLIDIGVGFSRKKEILSLTQEGGHSARRIAHAHDATGKEIERALIFHVRQHQNIHIFESHLAVDLLMQDGVCKGAEVLHTEKKEIELFRAKATILASGGAGQVFERNCNPSVATGDGIAMAARAGAEIRDMEFIQFHPTALALEGKPTFLLSETIRGEGAILVNAKGERFMESQHELKELAPRDIVARAIYAEMKHGPVYLDITHRESAYIKARFPYIYEQLWWYGIKMDKDRIPVAPAAHYTCGGVHTNLKGETNIPGLFAFGEVAHTGVHGANRLASNSLLECMVFSEQTVPTAVAYVQDVEHVNHVEIDSRNMVYKKTDIHAIKKEIQKIMWEHVGIIRHENELKKTLQKLKSIQTTLEKLQKEGKNEMLVETKNLADVAILITKAAIERKESIGCHFIAD